jgi:hypothetical protein
MPDTRPPAHLVGLRNRQVAQEAQPTLSHSRHSPVGIHGRLGGWHRRHQRHLHTATHKRTAHWICMHASNDTKGCTRADPNSPNSSPQCPPQQTGSPRSPAPAPPRPPLPGGHPWPLGRRAGPPSTVPVHSETKPCRAHSACTRSTMPGGAPGLTETRPPAHLVGLRNRETPQEDQPLLRHGRHSPMGIHGRLGGGQGRHQRHLYTAKPNRAGHTGLVRDQRCQGVHQG